MVRGQIVELTTRLPLVCVDLIMQHISGDDDPPCPNEPFQIFVKTSRRTLTIFVQRTWRVDQLFVVMEKKIEETFGWPYYVRYFNLRGKLWYQARHCNCAVTVEQCGVAPESTLFIEPLI